MSDAYVFISYARQDRAFVERLLTGLRAARIETWTDLENITAGRDWADEIDRGLQKAKVLIYVSSRHSGQSRWMDQEYAAYLKTGNRVVPVIVDEEGPANLPTALQRFQWVDFRGPFGPALQQLLDGIRDLRGSSPISAPTQKSKGYVFISYADEDNQFVDELKSFLGTQGYGYWDFRESERDYQADFTLELENVIKNAAGTLRVCDKIIALIFSGELGGLEAQWCSSNRDGTHRI